MIESSTELLALVLGATAALVFSLYFALWNKIGEVSHSPRLKFELILSVLDKKQRLVLIYSPLIILGFVLVAIFAVEGYFHAVIVAMDQYSSLFSLLLTGLLVVLYFAQHRTLRRQIDIVDQQVDYARADHSPEIIVEEWFALGDEVEFTLSNIGNGLAKDLSFIISVDYLSEGNHLKVVEIPLGALREPLNRLDTSERIDYLKAGEQHIKFSTEATVPPFWDDDDEIPVLFTESLEHIQTQMTDTEQPPIFVEPKLVYKDIAGEKHTISLFKEIIDICQLDSFEDAVTSPRKIGVGNELHPPRGHPVNREHTNYSIIFNDRDSLDEITLSDVPREAIDYHEFE